MTAAYVALGSNLGDRLALIAGAVRELEASPGVKVRWVSPVYESEPWGVTDQPAFANAVAAIEFEGEADVLLSELQEIEERLGREPGMRFGPRPIDLDILLFGDEEWDSPGLTIPHPRMLERDFVVTPLLDVAPDAALPDGTPVTRERATEGRVTGVLGEVQGFAGTSRAPAVAGAARVEPTPAEAREEWVPVGPARFEMTTPNSSADFDQLLYEQVLQQAGIPCEFYPHRPGEGASQLYGLPEAVRLMVPRSRAAEAEDLIEALRRQGA